MSERLRVLHLIKSLGRGGAEVLLLETLLASDRSRFEYSFAYFLPWKDALVQPLEQEGVEVTCFAAGNPAAILARTPTVIRHLRREAIDLVHCHLPLAGVVGRLAGRIAGVPVVYTEHGPIEHERRLTRRANLATWKLQRAVVTVSKEVAVSVRRHAGISVPIRLVENAVAVDRFEPDRLRRRSTRERLGVPSDAPVVGTVAVFRAQKRLHEWLLTARRLHASHPRTRFVVVGDGPLRTDLVEQSRNLGLEPALSFVGLQEDVRPYLDAMDVYLMTSGFEGLPVALLEAMAMELPVVSTAVGGVPDAVTPSSGVLTGVGEVEALWRAVATLLDEPKRRRAMGAAARRRIEERFSMERMVGEIEELYLEVLGRVRS